MSAAAINDSYILPTLEMVVKFGRIALGLGFAPHQIHTNNDGTMSLEFADSEALAKFMHDHVTEGTRISKMTPLIDMILSIDVAPDNVGRIITFNPADLNPAVLRETYSGVTKEERARIVLKDLKSA